MNAALLAVTGASLALTVVMATVVWRLTRQERRRSDARVAALADALYDDDTDKSRIVAHLLETRPAPGWQRQLFAAAVGVAVVAIAASLMAIPARSAKADRSAKASRSVDPPLELMALEHERAGDDLVVRGLVRNPANAAERDGLSAVVLVLDAKGETIGTARASLPAARLVAGATTPFVVNVTGAGDVDRFRLSFRTDARVEPHVDRRHS